MASLLGQATLFVQSTVSLDEDWRKVSSKVEGKKVGCFSHSRNTKRFDNVTSAIASILITENKTIMRRHVLLYISSLKLQWTLIKFRITGMQSRLSDKFTSDPYGSNLEEYI
jgi:hypothetical protein